ncbi:helix-turn-helix domain-containing protein [Emticicia sp.]|uniref:helix-turn-helix domain-containing protein n=1 Tax=Emticicia sp. TaxID=1930953 RepID=UPI00375308C9
MKNALLILLFLLSNPSFSQIKIHYQDTPPKIDGDISDWKLAFYSFKQTSHSVKSSNTLRYNFGFDEEHLFGILQVFDKHLTDLAKDKSGSPRITFNDGIEFYIDTQNNSQTVMDDDDFQLIMDFMGNLTVFRGGDNYLIKIERYKVPKDTVTNHFVMDYATKYEGTINKNADLDSGYVIEFQIAWAALGIRPKPNESFKIDICLNDADEFLDIRPLSEEAMIPKYAFQSIDGDSDFGFPNKWTNATLVGEASAWKKAKILFGHWLWIIAILTLIVSTWLIVGYLRKEKEIITIKEKIFQVVGVKENLDAFQAKCREFILENLENDISPAGLAENLNVSLRQLQRQFKEETDATPTDFIRKIKLEEAAKLLVEGKQTIAEIAYSIGFSDPAYFSRIFKKHFNKTPTNFQENAQKA